MTADERLLNCKHITDVSHPYVWQLRLTKDEFDAMETCIKESINAHGGDAQHLITSEFALITITYIAEWYKRKYKSGAEFPIESINQSSMLETLWTVSGIDKSKFVCQRPLDKKHLWQYSLYVLGGMALSFEISRRENVRKPFLKRLCRLLHNQSDGDERFASEDRAVAFCESVRKEQSIYLYIKALVNGDADNYPFEASALSDPSTPESRFLEAIKNADAEVLNEKFKYEWLIYHDDRCPYMQRRLRAHLLPEQDGKYHDYLLHHRLKNQWGIDDSKKMHKIFLYLRFKDGERIVQDIETAHPLMTFANTGDFSTGLHLCDARNYGETFRIPSSHFSSIEIVACDENDKELTTMQPYDMPEYMQLWQTEECASFWSSKKNRRHETAIIFNDNWRCDALIDDRKPFKNKAGKLSEQWNWKYVCEKVELFNVFTEEALPFFNLIGDIKISVTPYSNVLLYDEPGLVKRTVIDMESGDVHEQMLTLLFRKDDIEVHKWANTEDEQSEPERFVPEEVWIKSLDDKQERYRPWEDNEYGARKLKFIIRGEDYILPVFILPSLLDNGEEQPIERNFENCCINYLDYEENPKTIKDEIIDDHKPLEPALKVKIGKFSDESADFVTLNVIRPTLRKDIYLDGSVKRYNDEHEFRLPYILKGRIIIHDFSEDGYKRFDCSQLNGLYEKIGNVRDAASAFWKDGKCFEANSLAPTAPAWLKVWLGNPESESKGDVRLWLWDYDKTSEPQEYVSSEIVSVKLDTRMFYSMKNVNEDMSCYFGRQGQAGMMNRKLRDSHVKCFELAMEHNVYFFTFKPLRDMVNNKNQKSLLYDRLVEEHNGLSTEDKRGLLRLSEEFLFDWKDRLTDNEYNNLIEQ